MAGGGGGELFTAPLMVLGGTIYGAMNGPWGLLLGETLIVSHFNAEA